MSVAGIGGTFFPLAAKLEASGIAVERRHEWAATEYGGFVRIHDPEGLPIDLREPPSIEG